MGIEKASKRIFIALLSLISFITAVFLYMGHFHHTFVLETLVDEEKQLATNIYNRTFKNITEKYLFIANDILTDPQILSAIEKEDRAELLHLTEPIYKKLLLQNPYLHIMHFHTKKTKSFLRLHKPDKFGDDLSDIRHMINNVNRLQTEQIGIEVGRYGIYYRIALPVTSAQGKHLGAFEFGININYIFDFFDTDYGFTSLLLLKKDIFDIIYENNKGLHYKSFSDEYYLIEPNKNPLYNLLTSSIVSRKYTLIEHNNIDNLIFTVTDLQSIMNEDIGKILFVKNLNYYTDQISIIKRITISAGLLLLLFSFYFLRKIFTNYVNIIHRYQNILEVKNRTLSKLAHVDHLTKINNRKSIDRILKKEIKRAKRTKQALSLIMLDIDDFKMINDKHGHNSGDTVLKHISKTVSSIIRETDAFGRWGGEEFIIVAPDTTIDRAMILAEKIRVEISESDFLKVGRVSCSIGVSQYRDSYSFDILVNNADTALYKAKNSGKNKVLAYTNV